MTTSDPLQDAADRVGKAIVLGTRFRRDDVALLHAAVLRQLPAPVAGAGEGADHD